MSVALLTADLMLGSQVVGAAARVGEQLRAFATIDQLCEALAAAPASLVIVDLSLPGLDVSGLISRLHVLPHGSPRTLAFGSHVHVDRLAAARTAGCDRVVSRGQFHAQVDEFLAAAAKPTD